MKCRYTKPLRRKLNECNRKWDGKWHIVLNPHDSYQKRVKYIHQPVLNSL